MPTETLVHIVPTVPPAFNGLADYCYKLWEHWPQPRPVWKCLVARVPEGAQAAWPDAEISAFALSKNGLFSALEQAAPSCVVLHYVGYAYQKKGAPIWLPAALRLWKQRSGGRLCVIFHEIHAVGTPRQSAYWLQPLTKRIVTQLADLADSWVTTNEAATVGLVQGLGVSGTRGRVLPVGSVIEPSALVDFERPWPLSNGGKLRVIVFGLPSSRASAMRAHTNILKLACERDLIESIALVGKSGDASQNEAMQQLQEQIAPNRGAEFWQTRADLTPDQISQLFAENHLALSRNLPEHLTKSTIYAAACVHGLITLCLPARSEATPDLKLGQGSAPFRAPHLSNADEHPQSALDALQNARAIGELRAQVREVALHRLNWSNITREWAQAVRGS